LPQVKREHLLAAAAVLLPLAAMFAPVLLTDRLFAMRDTGHYYYPLFKWCAGEWGAGRVPLWNAGENCGTSVIADPTASVFYPGKLAFALPVDFAVRFKLYVVGHVLLAAAAAYWLARHFGSSVYGSALAALSYAGGGSIAFQHANVVYLVGAAWLPLAVGLLDRILGERRPRGRESLAEEDQPLWNEDARQRLPTPFTFQHRVGAALSLGVVLAMMVLGGDPQMAYHVVVIGGIYGVVLVSGKREPNVSENRTNLLRRFALLAASAGVAFLLAAVQILPSAEAVAESERAQSATTLFGPPQPGTHQAAAFDYSVAPWRLAELIWPNCGGRMYPTHRRWFSLLPEDSRIWTPSLYLGLLPLVLGLSMFSLRASDARIRWLSWLVLIFMLGSFGTFGLGWLARQANALGGGTDAFPIGDGVGGAYWLLCIVLPKYAMFRYPAKLFVVAALGISVLAASGWDRALAEPNTRLRRTLLVLGSGSLLAAGAVLVASQFVVLGKDAVDSAFGPFDSTGAWLDVGTSLVHASIVALASGWLLGRASLAYASGYQAGALLLVCALELAFANYWLVPTAPASLWRDDSPIANVDNQQRVFRASRWWPAEFATRGSPDRLAGIVQWERQTLAGRYALVDGVPLVNTSPRPIANAEYERLLDQVAAGPGGQIDEAALRRLGVELLILPDSVKLPFAERIENGELPDGAALWRVKQPLTPEENPIEHIFDPPSFQRGAIISAASWVVLAATAFALFLRRRNQSLKSNSSAPA
jgi:hypothetical protein